MGRSLARSRGKRKQSKRFGLRGRAKDGYFSGKGAGVGRKTNIPAWLGLVPLLWAMSAAGQAYRTPVRASWTEDPTTTATITWDRPESGRGTVRYGTSTNYTHLERDGGGTHLHAITLRGLEPGTRYCYEASSTDGYVQPGTFRTAPADNQPLHFAFHGDLQGGIDETGAQGVSGRIVAEDPPFVVSLGDMAEEAFSDSGFETWEVFFRICSNELARTIYVPTMGNHDAAPGSDVTRGLYQRLFSLPEPSLGNGFYSFAAGNVRFISLNTEIDAVSQGEWLERELQAAANDPAAVWTIATCHRPPYSYGERAGDDYYKTNWAPILTRYEADFLVSGHSHNYQRMVPIRGVRYLVAGGGGGRLYTSAVGESAQAFATTCYHHVSVHVTNDVLQMRGIRSDGLVFDSAIVTNRRQVRVEPAFPLRGQTAKISYRATEGPLAGANPVRIHIGQDAFAGAFADEPMAWNAESQRWEYEFTVPAAATQRVAFVFHDGAGTWHNNYDYNWQALLERASVSPDPAGAGSNATLRYEADMGPLAGAGAVTAWVSYAEGSFAATTAVALANVSGARWEGALAVPAHAERIAAHFTASGLWDDNAKRGWSFPVAGATDPYWPPAPVAGSGSPVVADNPSGEFPDNVGDNFDLATPGPPLRQLDAPRGFGDFGSVWANADADYLYLGGHGMDIGGSNNVVVLFAGLDTLADNAWNLWHKTGRPFALDYLHNVRFTEPMDFALVLGDTYGDGPAYTNFNLGGTGGYNFGQGIFYVGTNWGEFVPMTSAKLSQFHGTGTVATTTAGEAANRRTKRWEAALPWSALDAAGPESLSNLFVCGVIASSSTNGNDRYVSRTVLGERAWGERDEYRQYGFNTVNVRPLRVNLLHADLRGDGISNGWRQAYFGTPDGPPADEDTDGDGFDNGAEEIAGTHPLDRDSFCEMGAEFAGAGAALVLRWPSVAERLYDVYFTTNLSQPFEPLATGLSTNAYAPESNGFYRLRIMK